jgi:hypothetical protein
MALNVHKVREEIRLNDEPDSPVYELLFKDSEIDRIFKQCREFEARAVKLKDKIIAASPDEEKVLKKQLTAALKDGIELFLGPKAYKEIVAYIGDGLPASEISYELSSILAYLAVRLYERVQNTQLNEARKYMRDNEQGPDII